LPGALPIPVPGCTGAHATGDFTRPAGAIAPSLAAVLVGGQDRDVRFHPGVGGRRRASVVPAGGGRPPRVLSWRAADTCRGARPPATGASCRRRRGIRSEERRVGKGGRAWEVSAQ